MSLWRVHSAARADEVALGGLYGGASAFLVDCGAGLVKSDARLMNLPGVWSMALGESSFLYQPQALLRIRDLSNYDKILFSNPSVLKIVNRKIIDYEFDGVKACHYPNVLGFDFDESEEVRVNDFCRLRGKIPKTDNSFIASIAILYQLGFKNLFIFGGRFDDMSENFFDTMAALVPALKTEGMNIMSCGTGIEGVLDAIPFHEAISQVVNHGAGGSFD